MKNILIKAKGVTLIALITTIVVILILASVATTSGIGVIEQAELNRFTAEMKIMQTYVNQLYQKYKDGEKIQVGSEEYTGDEILTMRKNSLDASISTNIENSSLPAYSVAQQVFTSNESGITDKTGYLYFNKKLIEDLNIEGVYGEFFINISKRSVISYEGLNYKNQMYYTLEQLPSRLYNVEYETENINQPVIGEATIERVSEGKWRINISDIQYNGYVEKWQVKYKLDTDESWSISEDLSFVVSKNGNYSIQIQNGSVQSEIINVTEKGVYVLTIQSEDETKGEVTPNVISQKYSNGEAIQLEATEKEGYKFQDWYDGTNVISNDKIYKYIVSKDATISARFQIDN